MENSIYEKQLRELEDELSVFDDTDILPVDRLRQAQSMINKAVANVKAAVLADGFASVDDEIIFFKKIKPGFYALLLFETFYYGVCSQVPVGTKEMVRSFFEEELLQVFRLFRVNSFHYQYYKTKATALDHLYFLRGAQPADVPVMEVVDPLPGFSTAMDYPFAKFMAYERLQHHLLDRLTDLQREHHNAAAQMKTIEGKLGLRWTGESINLVELAYGIWLTGQVNNGNASITEIIGWLEVNLDVKIGLAFRRWSSISARKRVSQTKYIDQVKEAVLRRLDEELGR